MEPSLDDRARLLGDIGERTIELFRWLQREVTLPHEGLIPVTRAEADVLRVILDSPGLTLTDIARAIGQQRSNTSTLIKVLVMKGMAEKETSKVDGRTVEIYPTELAMRNLAGFRQIWASVLEVGDDLSDEELRAASKVLTTLAGHLHRQVTDEG